MEFLHFVDLLSPTHPPRSICDSFAAGHPLGSSFDPSQCCLTGTASASSHSLLESVSRTEILSFNLCIMPFQSSNDTHNSKIKDRDKADIYDSPLNRYLGDTSSIQHRLIKRSFEGGGADKTHCSVIKRQVDAYGSNDCRMELAQEIKRV